MIPADAEAQIRTWLAAAGDPATVGVAWRQTHPDLRRVVVTQWIASWAGFADGLVTFDASPDVLEAELLDVGPAVGDRIHLLVDGHPISVGRAFAEGAAAVFRMLFGPPEPEAVLVLPVGDGAEVHVADADGRLAGRWILDATWTASGGVAGPST